MHLAVGAHDGSAAANSVKIRLLDEYGALEHSSRSCLPYPLLPRLDFPLDGAASPADAATAATGVAVPPGPAAPRGGSSPPAVIIMMKIGKMMYQYFINIPLGPVSVAGLVMPGMSAAPCERAKNLSPTGGFVGGNRVGINIPGVAVSNVIVDLKVGTSSRGDNS